MYMGDGLITVSQGVSGVFFIRTFCAILAKTKGDSCVCILVGKNQSVMLPVGVGLCNFHRLNHGLDFCCLQIAPLVASSLEPLLIHDERSQSRWRGHLMG